MRRRHALPALLAATAACGTPTVRDLGWGDTKQEADGIAWTRVEGSGPIPRWGHVAVFDPSRGQVVAFGGSSPWGPLGDVWTYSLAESTWTPVEIDGDRPAPRFTAAGIADPARDRFVMLGGWSEGAATEEAWAFSLEAHRWARLPGGPPARFDAAAATDGVRAWFFGGFDGDGVARDDLWELDLGTDTWRPMPAGQARPSPRTNVGFGFVAGVLLLVGGHDESGLTTGAWRYDLTNEAWTELEPDGLPTAGAHVASAGDECCGAILLYGGDNDDAVDVPFLEAMTFEGRFARVPPLEDLPPARRHAAIALDPRSRTLVLFGGWSGADETLGDTWTLSLGACP